MLQHCQAIRHELFAAVEAGLKNTHHSNSRPVTAFLCPNQNESCSTQLHTAHISDNGKRWICSMNSNVFDSLTPDQTLWLSGSGKPSIIHKCQYSQLNVKSHYAHVIEQSLCLLILHYVFVDHMSLANHNVILSLCPFITHHHTINTYNYAISASSDFVELSIMVVSKDSNLVVHPSTDHGGTITQTWQRCSEQG